MTKYTPKSKIQVSKCTVTILWYLNMFFQSRWCYLTHISICITRTSLVTNTMTKGKLVKKVRNELLVVTPYLLCELLSRASVRTLCYYEPEHPPSHPTSYIITPTCSASIWLWTCAMKPVFEITINWERRCITLMGAWTSWQIICVKIFFLNSTRACWSKCKIDSWICSSHLGQPWAQTCNLFT